MGKTHSKPSAPRHGMGTAWTRHAMCESAFTRPLDPCIVQAKLRFKVTVFAAQMWGNEISREGNGLFILTGSGTTKLKQSSYICEETKNILH
jgi:hypothetical protein